MVAVLLFHFDLLPGGWLGVDLFFVLSGFLITRLLVHEQATTGAVILREFWRRRARRLLPALFAVLAGVSIYAAWYPEKVTLPQDLGAQMLATIFYVANWQSILGGGGYWDQYAVQSPLGHMWSLSIEEQFYVVFPLVMVGLFAVLRRRVNAAWLLLGGAVASWSLGVWLLIDGGDFERVYMGTDTRIGGILLGASIGYLTCVPKWRAPLIRWARRLEPFAVVGVLTAIVTLDGTATWTPQRWLFMPAFEVGVTILLVSALGAASSGPIIRIVTSAPVVWLGTISYGLYLWHVPIMLAAERAMVSAPRIVVVLVALSVSLLVAQISFRWLEQPIRKHGFALAGQYRLTAVAVFVVVASLVMTGWSTRAAREVADSRSSTPRTQVVQAPPDTDGSTPSLPAAPAAPGSTAGPSTSSAAELPLARPEGRDGRILLLGDSIAYDMTDAFLGESPELAVTASASSLVGCGIGGVAVDPSQPAGLSDADTVRKCDDWLDDRAGLVSQTQPDVVLLLRANVRRDPVDASTCDPEYRSWLAGVLRSEINQLGSTGAVVAVASRLYVRMGNKASASSDDTTDCVNAVLRSVTEAEPNAVYLPLNEWVCPTRETCRRELDGVVLRPDGLHFQGKGSIAATRWIIQRLFG